MSFKNGIREKTKTKINSWIHIYILLILSIEYDFSKHLKCCCCHPPLDHSIEFALHDAWYLFLALRRILRVCSILYCDKNDAIKPNRINWQRCVSRFRLWWQRIHFRLSIDIFFIFFISQTNRWSLKTNVYMHISICI